MKDQRFTISTVKRQSMFKDRLTTQAVFRQKLDSLRDSISQSLRKSKSRNRQSTERKPQRLKVEDLDPRQPTTSRQGRPEDKENKGMLYLQDLQLELKAKRKLLKLQDDKISTLQRDLTRCQKAIFDLQQQNTDKDEIINKNQAEYQQRIKLLKEEYLGAVNSMEQSRDQIYAFNSSLITKIKELHHKERPDDRLLYDTIFRQQGEVHVQTDFQPLWQPAKPELSQQFRQFNGKQLPKPDQPFIQLQREYSTIREQCPPICNFALQYVLSIASRPRCLVHRFSQCQQKYVRNAECQVTKESKHVSLQCDSLLTGRTSVGVTTGNCVTWQSAIQTDPIPLLRPQLSHSNTETRLKQLRQQQVFNQLVLGSVYRYKFNQETQTSLVVRHSGSQIYKQLVQQQLFVYKEQSRRWQVTLLEQVNIMSRPQHLMFSMLSPIQIPGRQKRVNNKIIKVCQLCLSLPKITRDAQTVGITLSANKSNQLSVWPIITHKTQTASITQTNTRQTQTFCKPKLSHSFVFDQRYAPPSISAVDEPTSTINRDMSMLHRVGQMLVQPIVKLSAQVGVYGRLVDDQHQGCQTIHRSENQQTQTILTQQNSKEVQVSVPERIKSQLAHANIQTDRQQPYPVAVVSKTNYQSQTQHYILSCQQATATQKLSFLQQQVMTEVATFQQQAVQTNLAKESLVSQQFDMTIDRSIRKHIYCLVSSQSVVADRQKQLHENEINTQTDWQIKEQETLTQPLVQTIIMAQQKHVQTLFQHPQQQTQTMPYLSQTRQLQAQTNAVEGRTSQTQTTIESGNVQAQTDAIVSGQATSQTSVDCSTSQAQTAIVQSGQSQTQTIIIYVGTAQAQTTVVGSAVSEAQTNVVLNHHYNTQTNSIESGQSQVQTCLDMRQVQAQTIVESISAQAQTIIIENTCSQTLTEIANQNVQIQTTIIETSSTQIQTTIIDKLICQAQTNVIDSVQSQMQTDVIDSVQSQMQTDVAINIPQQKQTNIAESGSSYAQTYIQNNQSQTQVEQKLHEIWSAQGHSIIPASKTDKQAQICQTVSVKHTQTQAQEHSRDQLIEQIKKQLELALADEQNEELPADLAQFGVLLEQVRQLKREQSLSLDERKSSEINLSFFSHMGHKLDCHSASTGVQTKLHGYQSEEVQNLIVELIRKEHFAKEAEFELKEKVADLEEDNKELKEENDIMRASVDKWQHLSRVNSTEVKAIIVKFLELLADQKKVEAKQALKMLLGIIRPDIEIQAKVQRKLLKEGRLWPF